jgi:hypothetical protein
VIVWVIEPAVAVTVTVYCCLGVLLAVETVKVDVACPTDERATLVGDSEGDGPWLTMGDTLHDRVAIPE